jgi:hypothetical protein
MIEIGGLNKRQKALCEILWGMDSTEATQTFINSLPQRDQQECRTLMSMMVLATIDEIDTVSEEVQELIDGIRHR